VTSSRLELTALELGKAVAKSIASAGIAIVEMIAEVPKPVPVLAALAQLGERTAGPMQALRLDLHWTRLRHGLKRPALDPLTIASRASTSV